MFYESTRGGTKSIPSTEAIKRGISKDGGLFVPSQKVKLTNDEILKYADMNYRERAICILKNFLDDYTDVEIKDCVNNAYDETKFSSEKIAPVISLNDNLHVLELWHGPTCAFKDMALQILPHFLVKALAKTGEKNEIVILVATSGDTGKAALEGFKDIEGTKVIVFFPKDGVSDVQKMQMITQEGKNVYSVAVEGNFDDAQNGVKAIFTDYYLAEMMPNNNYKFSSANSINWGRLVPQIVYYFSSYADLIKQRYIKVGDKVNFVVPTGNFGNILAAYYAKEMGLPVNKLICASNENNVLTDFINTGIYDRRREFKKTVSPSMDILISSNLERLLYEVTDHNDTLIRKWMTELKEDGVYSVDNDIKNKIASIFWAGFCNEEDTLKTIKSIYNEYNYVCDTHTAVGVDVYDKYVISTGDMTRTVIVSTASPFKFNQSVSGAILGESNIQDKNEFELINVLSKKCDLKVPVGLKNLDKKEILHKMECHKEDMKSMVGKILQLR